MLDHGHVQGDMSNALQRVTFASSANKFGEPGLNQMSSSMDTWGAGLYQFETWYTLDHTPKDRGEQHLRPQHLPLQPSKIMVRCKVQPREGQCYMAIHGSCSIYFDARGTSWKQNLTRSYNIHLLIRAEIHTNRNQILKLKSSQQVLWPAQVPMAHWAPPKFSGCRWQQQVDTVPVCHSEFLQTLTCINTLNPITSYPHVQRSFDLPMHQAGSLSSFILLLRCVRRSILLLCAIVSSLNSTLRLFMAFPHNKWQMHEGFSNLLSQQCHAILLWNHRNRGFPGFRIPVFCGHPQWSKKWSTPALLITRSHEGWVETLRILQKIYNHHVICTLGL